MCVSVCVFVCVCVVCVCRRRGGPGLSTSNSVCLCAHPLIFVARWGTSDSPICTDPVLMTNRALPSCHDRVDASVCTIPLSISSSLTSPPPFPVVCPSPLSPPLLSWMCVCVWGGGGEPPAKPHPCQPWTTAVLGPRSQVTSCLSITRRRPSFLTSHGEPQETQAQRCAP